jgi:hypothetical protein
MAIIKRFGVIKMASFMGLYGVAMGLIFGIIFALFSLGGIAYTEAISGIFGFMFGIWAIIFLPIFYGIMMFLVGLIFTPIINLILRIINGIDLDIEMKQQV